MSMKPILRFKTKEDGFIKDWSQTLLSKIATVTMGQSPNSDAYNDDYDGLPLIQGNADIVDGFTKPSRYTTEITKRCRENDVILSVRAPVGELGIATEESCIGRGVCAIRANDQSDTAFIYQLLQAKKKNWRKVEQGSTFTAISGEDVKEFEVIVPSKEEQQKIAVFFSELDKKISIIDRKTECIRRVKLAMTRNLLHKRSRFLRRDGTSFEEWTIKKIDEIAIVTGGGTPSTSKEEYWNGNIQWFTPAEIDSKYVHSSKKQISEQGLKKSSAKLLPKNALLLTTRASLGLCSINRFDGKVCTNQGFQSLICKDGFYSEFVYYLVTSEDFKKEMISRAAGSTFLEISSRNLKAIQVAMPGYEEQKKIAEFLGLLDHKLDALQEQNRLLNSLKKALAQRMFV